MEERSADPILQRHHGQGATNGKRQMIKVTVQPGGHQIKLNLQEPFPPQPHEKMARFCVNNCHNCRQFVDKKKTYLFLPRFAPASKVKTLRLKG